MVLMKMLVGIVVMALQVFTIPGRVISGQTFASTTRVRKEHLDAAFSHLEDLELGSKVALTSKHHMKVREKIMLI